jgi:hypothetical protein
MKTWILLFFIFSSQIMAQEQVAIRLNEQGLMKILRMAVKYNTATKESRTVVVPKNIYKFTIPREKILSNPIVPVLNEISDLNLTKDLDFYLNTSDILISGTVDEKSLKATIFNSHDNGFDLRLGLNLPQVTVDGSNLSLCEDKERSSKNCGSGLKATLSKIKIKTVSRPVVLTAVLRLRTDGEVARVSVISVDSNLEGKGAPDLDINFKSLDIPRIAIVINGQETELDTSRLKDEILKRKTFLAQKLLGFAAEFITSDVAEMINVYLINQKVATSWQVYRHEAPLTFNEFVKSRDAYPIEDGHFVRSPAPTAATEPLKVMLAQISEVIRNAQVSISLKKIGTPGNKDIELSGLIGFILNGRQMAIRNTLGNTNRQLPKLDLSKHRHHDLNLALSETTINGALDLVNSTNLFQEIFEATSDVKGFSIRNVKLHFTGNSSFVVVVNSSVDLKKLKAESVKEWVKNKIATLLERNNNQAVIYFPIEVEVIPVFKQTTKGMSLELKVLSPFNRDNLYNRFKYPSNVGVMHDVVKDGVMEKLRESLEGFTNKTYPVDLSQFLNQAGVEFMPKGISINQGAYLLLNLDITDIKFNSKTPNKR